MAQLFKNFIATTNTTGSAVTFLECPTGKTLVTTNITAYNDNASNATQTLHLTDKSESTAYTIVFGDTDGYAITAKNAIVWGYNFILEEGDKIGFQTDVNAQRISGSYVLLDSASKTRYRHKSIKITTEDQYATLLTAPAGHTLIVKVLRIGNISGTNASNNVLRLVEATTNTYVPIETGTVNDTATAVFTQTQVLEPGDSLQLYNAEQPFTSTILYMELPTPSIRA